jgi:hypothetical protein
MKTGKTAKLMVMVSNASTQTEVLTVSFKSDNPAVVPDPAPITVNAMGKKSEKQKNAKSSRGPVVVPAALAKGTTKITAFIGTLSSNPCAVSVK